MKTKKNDQPQSTGATRPATESVDYSPIKICPSKVVFVIASVYPTPFKATVEAVQNAIDSGAKRVQIIIDLFGNRKPKERCVIVRDNGIGMSREEFARKMANIGLSEKAASTETLGRHGLGLMSFLGKAGYYALTSGPKEHKSTQYWEGYTTHYFSNQQVVDGLVSNQGMMEVNDELVVPSNSCPELSNPPQWWNTEVLVKDFATARLTISADALEDEIRSEFNIAMLKHNTEIDIIHTDSRGKTTTKKINPRRFTGAIFKAHTVIGQHCGKVNFEMYRSLTPVGVVTIKTSQDSYTKDWKKMADQAIALGMNKKKAEALGSGHFEGIITVQNCEWDFDRRGFKPTDELAWIDLLLAISEWMDTESVKRYLVEVLGKKEEEREFELLNRLSTHFSGLYNRDAELLYEPLINLPAGVSAGHSPVADATTGYNGRSRQRSRPPGTVVKTETEKPKSRDSKGATENKNQTHFSVERDKGNARFVSKTQLGLSFGIRSIGSYDPYCWDLENGILVINRDHPYYQAIKESDEKVWAYLLGIAEWAVCQLMVDEAEREAVESSLRQMEKQFMRFLTDRISQMKTTKS